MKSLLLFSIFTLSSFSVYADSAIIKNGVSFSHNDWEITCDNTLTCRAAGYQLEEDYDHPVSILLTRKAGANEPITAQISIAPGDKFTPVIALYINNKNLGRIKLNSDVGMLTSEQTQLLLSSLRGNADIQLRTEDDIYKLSDKGASAVLLKMDDVQGRVNTPSAIIKKGNATTMVPSAKPMPIIRVPVIPPTTESDKKWIANNQSAILDLLKNEIEGLGDLCDSDNPIEPTINRLSTSQFIVSTPCWRAAYNSGTAFWIINNTAPFNPQLITTSGSHYENGEISTQMKGRGLGDCWSSSTMAWNGKQFVPSRESNTGMCRGFAGGAWELPTLVSEVKR